MVGHLMQASREKLKCWPIIPNSITAEGSLMVQHQARHPTSSLNDLEPTGSVDEAYTDSVGLIS